MSIPIRAPRGARSGSRILVAEVRRRTEGIAPRSYPTVDLVELTRRKVEPMVRGLFPKVEQPVVLEALRNSTVMICADTIEGLILNESWPHTAWMLANMYLL